METHSSNESAPIQGSPADLLPARRNPARNILLLGGGLGCLCVCLLALLVAGGVLIGRSYPAQPTSRPTEGVPSLANQASSPPAASAEPAGTSKVGISLSDIADERWKNEADLLTKLLRDKGYEVLVQEAAHDVRLQNDQIDSMVARGVGGLIVVAEDGNAVVRAVDRAAQAGVKVLAYDRLIASPGIAAYLSFSMVAVGEAQADGIAKALGLPGSAAWSADNPVRLVLSGGSPTDNSAILDRRGQMQVLQPFIDRGLIRIVADQWVDNWDPATAEKIMENILAAQQDSVDAVVASNDGTALGELRALRARGLAGRVPISGQDATADGCNSIVKGELTVTVLKDIRLLPPVAVDLMDALLAGKPVEGLARHPLADLTGDPSRTGDVMVLFLPVVEITKDNVYDVVVKSCFRPYDDVYRDVPQAQRPPRVSCP